MNDAMYAPWQVSGCRFQEVQHETPAVARLHPLGLGRSGEWMERARPDGDGFPNIGAASPKPVAAGARSDLFPLARADNNYNALEITKRWLHVSRKVGR